MGLLQALQLKLKRHNTHSTSIKTPPQAAIAPQPATPPQPPTSKSLTQLEREMAAEAPVLKTLPYRPPQKSRGLRKFVAIAALLSLPVGFIWVANLPYAPIRRPVARTAPILLLPSYITIDRNYREAIRLLEQADQLINQATSPTDLDLGERQLQRAQQSLDKLPLSFLNDFPEYRYWGYNWYFQSASFNSARAKVGILQAKVFQEKNAQTALLDAEQALSTAKQSYQNAANSVDQQLAITDWQVALTQLKSIPSQTLAGKTVQPKLAAYEDEFTQLVGLAAGNQRVNAIIGAARRFAAQAAQASQNPPHPVEEWVRVERLWQEAIIPLQQISPDDVQGYAIAQEKLAEYTANLEQIKVRRQAEQAATQSFGQAQAEIERLQALSGKLDSYELLSQLQSIINQLEAVQNGTTVYLEAQALLLQANNKLNQLQAP